MSNKHKQDPLPPSSPDLSGDSPPPARKRATRSAAVKSGSAEEAPVAKKTVVRKTAAKKVAAKKAVTAELPFSEPTPAPKPVRASRAKKPAAVEAPPAMPAPAAAESSRRFGRVPGGGPVVTRDAPPAAPPSTPFPQPVVAQENLPVQPPARREPRPPQEQPPRNYQQRDNSGQQRGTQGQPQESRSKRRREKRKRRNNERTDQQGQGHGQQQRYRQEAGPQGPSHEPDDQRPVLLSGPKLEADGMLELAPKGFGFLRVQKKNFEQARDDVFVTPEIIRKYNLRLGQWIHGLYQEGPRGPQLVEISSVNDLTPGEAAKLPHFDELKAINPTRRISFETTPDRYTTRVVDIMAPVGRGQRGLIVSPPRSGKTTLLLHMAEAIREKYDEAIHLMVVLVDERPEEVTEFRRALLGAEIYASSNDEQARNHTRIAELAIERAKRLVEAGKDVFLIMDSITRLARAYNGNMNTRGRGTASGGLTIGALEVPRRLFAAARNTRGGGSLTIMATALIQTNSRADEAIYMEFKGTGNMELVLDRKIAENYIYPAVDIFKSGTRREELLLADHMLHKIHLIRRGLSGHRPAEAMERLLFFQKKFPNNPQMLLEIKG